MLVVRLAGLAGIMAIALPAAAGAETCTQRYQICLTKERAGIRAFVKNPCGPRYQQCLRTGRWHHVNGNITAAVRK